MVGNGSMRMQLDLRSSKAWSPSCTRIHRRSCSLASKQRHVAALLRKPTHRCITHTLPSRGSHGSRRTGIIARGNADEIPSVGLDFLTFLSATVVVIPLFKRFNVSPVIAFLFSGFALQQLGLFHALGDMEKVSELGVLFLLFEMGLELSLDRLQALAKFAFGMGSLQVLICTVLFTLFALPVGHGVGTLLLEKLFNAPASLVSIRGIDEAIVIGAALSLSSSAFVLQILSERGQMTSRVGSATLGVLLFQDIAVVPLLVLLPLIESIKFNGGASPEALLQQLGPAALETLLGLGVLLLGGKYILRYIFEMVAASRSSESFVALCLLTVTGISQLTEMLGFSDTLGAFIAGVLLSETSFRTQVEADIRPFKGLLLGLFFVTTGSSINLTVLMNEFPIVASLLFGLLLVKTTVISLLGPQFGLTRKESIRTGFLLSQGGEFAFVLLSLANQLTILPENLNEVLIIVVVLSMALTPTLADTGKVVSDWLEEKWPEHPDSIRTLGGESGSASTAMASGEGEHEHFEMAEPLVICGFSSQAQMLVNMVESPLAVSNSGPISYIAFDRDPARVRAAQAAGFRVVYGDGSPSVLASAGVTKPRMVVVAYSQRDRTTKTVESLRAAFPAVPIYASARDLRHAAQLEEAGADTVVIEGTQAGLALGEQLLAAYGECDSNITFLRQGIEQAMAARAHKLAIQPHAPEDMSAARARADLLVLDTARLTSAARAAAGLNPQAQQDASAATLPDPASLPDSLPMSTLSSIDLPIDELVILPSPRNASINGNGEGSTASVAPMTNGSSSTNGSSNGANGSSADVEKVAERNVVVAASGDSIIRE